MPNTSKRKKTMTTTSTVRSHYWKQARLGNWGHDTPARRTAQSLGEAEFDQWLEERDREIAVKALKDWADYQERVPSDFAYVVDDADEAETKAWCNAARLYADHILTKPRVDTDA